MHTYIQSYLSMSLCLEQIHALMNHIYVCVYIYVCVCVYIYIYIYIYIYAQLSCAHIGIYTYLRVYTYIHTCVYIHIYIHTCVPAPVRRTLEGKKGLPCFHNLCMYVCMYIYIRIHIDVHKRDCPASTVCGCACINIHKYKYTCCMNSYHMSKPCMQA
jgi:hypothetical protein